MSHTTMPVRSPLLRDDLVRRLRWAASVSVLANLLLWRAVAAIAKHPAQVDLRPVEITRVVIDKGRHIEKVVTQKAIRKKIAQIRKPPPKPRPIPVVRRQAPPPPVRSRPVVVRRPASIPPPQGAHNRVLLAKGPAPAAPDNTALAGGSAAVGKAIDQQNPGNATANPPEPVKTQSGPTPAPQPAPSKPVPQPAPSPAPVKPQPPPKPPPQQPAPKPTGPTRDAQPSDEVQPEIPDDLKQEGNYKSFVHVKVLIEPDGSFTPILRTSSGNAEIDRRVLEALKKWKWKAAVRDGEAVESTQLFRFVFEVD